MSVVLVKHAVDAYCEIARLAKVLDSLVGVFVAGDDFMLPASFGFIRSGHDSKNLVVYFESLYGCEFVDRHLADGADSSFLPFFLRLGLIICIFAGRVVPYINPVYMVHFLVPLDKLHYAGDAQSVATIGQNGREVVVLVERERATVASNLEVSFKQVLFRFHYYIA